MENIASHSTVSLPVLCSSRPAWPRHLGRSTKQAPALRGTGRPTSSAKQLHSEKKNVCFEGFDRFLVGFYRFLVGFDRFLVGFYRFLVGFYRFLDVFGRVL